MLKKDYGTDGSVMVTFELPPRLNAQSATLCGDFNGWDERSLPMYRHRDGSFSITITLHTGQAYSFRYLLDGVRWENDWAADRYQPNPFGGDDSVVVV